MNKTTSIFEEEQRNIMNKFQKNKEIAKFVFWELMGILIVFAVSCIVPAINQDENTILFCIVFISSLVLIVVDLIVALIFAQKHRIANLLYFVMCLLMGVILKVSYKEGSIKNILVCSAIILMYYAIVGIVTLRKNKLFIFAAVMVLPIIYLCYKYLNLAIGYIIILLLNTAMLSYDFIVIIKKLSNEPNEEDFVCAKLSFLSIFVIENIFLSNLI